MTACEPQLEYSPCPVGCPQADDLVLVGVDRLHHLPGTFKVVRCRTCGLMRTDPRPTEESMGMYYPEDYSPYARTRIAALKQPHPLQKWWERTVGLLFETNMRRVPDVRAGRMLEIGSASGSFLHKMASRGWEVEGIEPSEKSAERARSFGYKVYCGTLENAPAPELPYDLVTAWMAVEHLRKPGEALEKVRSWCSPGAWLAASVPDAGALEFRLFKDYWYALQVPSHLYHFDPDTLGKVLHKAGWHLERVLHHRNARNLVESLGYVLEEKLCGACRPSSVVRFIYDGPAWAQTLLLPLDYLSGIIGQSGRMTIWARPE
jgi:2-polyprenyl-3-methyl-5-hydroxy-6-metoxy-1,4-benzoquinol methylase